MAAANPVADPDTVTEIALLVSEQCDHISPAVTGCIYRKRYIAFRAEQIQDLAILQF
jgi:hypothetical protein